MRFLTSGESHGKGLLGIMEGLPAGMALSVETINLDLERRQSGYGRGGRMKIETDTVEILSGVRHGETLGTPISFLIRNIDYANWQDIMSAEPVASPEEKAVYRPRPGHADLAGAMKYHHRDMRNVLERASARETAARVAAGSICKQLLGPFGICLYHQVLSIGSIVAQPFQAGSSNLPDLYQRVEASPLRCTDQQAEKEMMALIDDARREGESLGGSFEVGALGVPPGLGSHTAWDRKLDARISAALISIPAIKAVEIGDGFQAARLPGSEIHDQIYYHPESGLYRQTNRAGGIEGGITNGETIRACAYMKPIPTLYKPLQSVNTRQWCEEKAQVERSDICAVPAAAVVGEAMLALILAEAFLDKFSGDSWYEIQASLMRYRDYLKKEWQWEKTSS